MNEGEKIIKTRRQMEMAAMNYKQIVQTYPDISPSVGAVAKWDRIGGFSTNVSRPTEQAAMRTALMSETMRYKMAWLDAIYEAFFALIDMTGKGVTRANHDRKVAEVLKMSVFEGRNQASISDFIKTPDGYASRQYVSKLYGEAVFRVKVAADSKGLFDISGREG